jgi:hypothetical protein
VREYPDRLGSFLKIDIRDDDIANYRAVWNRRMTTLEDAFIGAACEEPRFRELIATIRERVATGNEFIEREFGLPLATFGYPMTACRQRARTLTLAKPVQP